MTVRLYYQNRQTLYSLRLRNDLFCVGWGVKLYSLITDLYSLQNYTDANTNGLYDSKIVVKEYEIAAPVAAC